MNVIDQAVCRAMLLFGALAVLIPSAPATAQQPPPLWLVATGDTVLVQIVAPPVMNYGFVVDRIGPDAALERLTEEPVVPERQPAYAAARLGADLPQVMRMAEAATEFQMLRRLEADPYTAGAASLLFRSAALVLGRLYIDTTARAGAEYEYRVTFLDAAGRETGDVRSARVRVVDVQPAAPTSVASVAGNEEATLGWRFSAYRADARDLAVAFRVYRAAGAGAAFESVTDLPLLRTPDEAHDFVDRGLRNGVEYRYQIRAVDVAGRESAPSAVVAVRPFDDRPPLAPQDLATEPGDGRVRLVWRMSPELNVEGYHVERSTGIDQPYSRVSKALIRTDAPVWTDEAVRGGTQYFYRVVAVTEQGRESKPGNAISAVPLDETPPQPPLAVTATAVDRRLRLRWSPSPSDDVLGYHVYRGDTPNRVSRLTTRPIAATEYLDVGFDERGLNPGERYTVRISAVDHAFNESAHVEIETQIPDDEPPAAPTALRVRNVEGRRVEITWSAGGSLDVERYRLTRVSTGTPGEVEVGVAAAAGRLLLEDTLVQSGAEYGYRLVAVDSAGNASEPAEARLRLARLEPPPAPRRATAQLAAGGVEVRWERVVDAELGGYRIYRSTLATGIYEPVSAMIAMGAERVFTDGSGGAQHYYTVRAIDRSGNESRSSPAATTVR